MKTRTALFVAVILASTLAAAQSSGSFNYSFTSPQTVCTDVGGTLSGGSMANDLLKTTMKVSSGNGVALVIRPSAVVGLVTDVSLSGKFGDLVSSGQAQETVTFDVTVTPLSGQAAPTVTPGAPVTYDDRFIKISTNLFGLLSQCTALAPCIFDFKETTLSAHSFDWVVTGLSSGDYGITVSWSFDNHGTAAPNDALACVGPAVLTAQQVKIFNQSTGINF